MCNLYRMNRAVAEVAGMFGVDRAMVANVPDKVYPGYPDIVIANDQARSMTWGFPLAMTGKRGQPFKPKPVNNAGEDKLGAAFGRDSFTAAHWLILVTARAEAADRSGCSDGGWLSLSLMIGKGL